jgi:regulator of extracellular matrix RemA (YlzA/DUF370 family)
MTGVITTDICTIKAVFELLVYCSANMKKVLLNMERPLITMLGNISSCLMDLMEGKNRITVDISPPREQINKIVNLGRKSSSIFDHTYDDPHRAVLIKRKYCALLFLTNPISSSPVRFSLAVL